MKGHSHFQTPPKQYTPNGHARIDVMCSHAHISQCEITRVHLCVVLTVQCFALFLCGCLLTKAPYLKMDRESEDATFKPH